ncbi:uncharacterized protein LOC135713701 [Ochlerotatus camptorhynchus]|uniref:uncharacterized protein LOC135713701 n=1 Tax=Ochlerotatus camptorhynchus TaxID=644619 RepID=UPI0031D34DF8
MDDNDAPRLDKQREDDASIETLSEGEEMRISELEWSLYASGKNNLEAAAQHHALGGRIEDEDGWQFIQCHERLTSGLPYSARFRFGGEEVWKLKSEGCLLTSGNHYLAKVSVEPIAELDGVIEFAKAKTILLKHLKVVKVFQDEQLLECKKAENDLWMLLKEVSSGSTTDPNHAEDLFQLWKMMRDCETPLCENFKLDVESNCYISSKMKHALIEYLSNTSIVIARNRFLEGLASSTEQLDFMKGAIKSGIDTHRAQLLTRCPYVMKDKLHKLDDIHILYVTATDLKLFADLDNGLDKTVFGPVLPEVISRFLTRIAQIDEDHLGELVPLTNRLYFFICMSLLEVAEEFKAALRTEVIVYKKNEWRTTTLCKDSIRSPLEKTLMQQLQMLVRLANHFEPGKVTAKKSFPYEFKVFQNLNSMPDEVHIWLCLLDDAIENVFKTDIEKMHLFSSLFKSYVSFVSSTDFENQTLESLRMVTHNALRSLTQIRSSDNQQKSVDDIILQCDEMIATISKQLPSEKNISHQVNRIRELLHQIVRSMMSKTLRSCDLASFAANFCTMLDDLKSFQVKWLIWMLPSDARDLYVKRKVIAPVDSKFNSAYQKCYQVIDCSKFVTLYSALHGTHCIPEHYQLLVLKALFKEMDHMVNKTNWHGGKHLTEKDQYNATNLLISNVRLTQHHFKIQANYQNFEDFYQDGVRSYFGATRDATGWEDFLHRLLPSEQQRNDNRKHDTSKIGLKKKVLFAIAIVLFCYFFFFFNSSGSKVKTNSRFF